MTPTLPAPSPREVAKRLLRGGRGTPAVATIGGRELHCVATILEGITYALIGPALHVGAAVRWP